MRLLFSSQGSSSERNRWAKWASRDFRGTERTCFVPRGARWEWCRMHCAVVSQLNLSRGLCWDQLVQWWIVLNMLPRSCTSSIVQWTIKSFLWLIKTSKFLPEVATTNSVLLACYNISWTTHSSMLLILTVSSSWHMQASISTPLCWSVIETVMVILQLCTVYCQCYL